MSTLPNIIPVKGDLFSIAQGVDGLAIFVPCGLTAFRPLAEDFVKRYKDSGLIIVYDPNPDDIIYEGGDVKPMIYRAMNLLAKNGARTVAMNAIRTNCWAGESERLVREAVELWLKENDTEHTFTVYLVDARGGFNR